MVIYNRQKPSKSMDIYNTLTIQKCGYLTLTNQKYEPFITDTDQPQVWLFITDTNQPKVWTFITDTDHKNGHSDS